VYSNNKTIEDSVIEGHPTKYRALANWFDTPLGMRVALSFSNEIQALREEISGQSLLQLGSFGDNEWLSLLHFRKKWIATPYRNIKKKASVYSSFSNLPLRQESIDCILAPFALEAFSLQKKPLDELDRILKPMGYIIFFGINPLSFWGMSLKLRRLDCLGHTPTKLVSSYWLKHTMLERGYRQYYFNSFFYSLPVNQPLWIKRLEFLNEMGKMIWPFPAGFYCLVLQKFQPHGLDLILEHPHPHLLTSVFP
jgi:hypothetical protein